MLKIPIIDSHGTPSWPELFSSEKIEQMRQTVGMRYFMSQMMLEFVSPERVRLDPGCLNFYDDEFDAQSASLGKHLITGKTLYWDPSTGRRRCDGSVCVLLYRDDKNRLAFIHDILYMTVPDTEQFPLSRQCNTVLEFMQNQQINRISVETNGVGGGLPEIICDCARRSGQNIYVNRVQNSKSKSDRILDALEPLLSTGRLFAHVRIRNTPFLSEMLAWSPVGGSSGIHDDGLDAVAGAITQPPIVVHPMGHNVQTFIANTNFSV